MMNCIVLVVSFFAFVVVTLNIFAVCCFFVCVCVFAFLLLLFFFMRRMKSSIFPFLIFALQNLKNIALYKYNNSVRFKSLLKLRSNNTVLERKNCNDKSN